MAASLELDLMEITCDTDAHAQAAYVTNDAGGTERKEYDITGDNDYQNDAANNWRGQTFTTTGAYTITSVKILIYRVGSPGTVTASIRAVDGSHLPTGADLCSGTTDGNTLTTNAAGEWREITFGAGYSLSATTEYALVVRAPSGTYSSVVVCWRCTSSSNYSGGLFVYSSDSGGSWGSAAIDCMFECYGSVTGSLQSYSEGTIKTQGSYALKGVATIDAINKTLTRTATHDLSRARFIKFDIRSTRTGSNIKVGFHDSGGTTTEITPNILTADTFQTVYVDLRAVTDANKNVIDSVIITIVNADAANTFYIDNMEIVQVVNVFGMIS